MPQPNIQAALAAGYSLRQINDELARASGANLAKARAAGYREEDILRELGGELPAPAPKPTSLWEDVKDVGNALVEGAQGTYRSARAAVGTAVGANQDVIDQARRNVEAQRTSEADALKALKTDIQARKEAGDEGLIAGVKNVVGAVAKNPAGGVQLLAEQAPNSAAALGLGYAGMKAGAAVGTALGGPVGTAAGAALGGTAGFLAGLFGANTLLETGGKALEAAAGGQFTDEDRSRVMREGAVKGAVITGVDAATLGVSKFILGAAGRAVEDATVRTLVDAGIDAGKAAASVRAAQEAVAKQAAASGEKATAEALQKATTEAMAKEGLLDPTLSAAVQAAQKSAFETAMTTPRRLGRGAATVGLESAGEGVGEYAGEYAATGKASPTEAVLEAFSGLSQSLPEIYAAKKLQTPGDLTAAYARAGTPGTEAPPADKLPGLQAEANASVDELKGSLDQFFDPRQIQASVAGAPTVDAAIAAAEQASSLPTTPREQRQMIDRQTGLLSDAMNAGTQFEREQAQAQAQAVLPRGREGISSQFADLTPMDARQAQQRLAILRDETASAGGNALELAIVPHPAKAGAFAIGRQALPSLELDNTPPTVSPAAAQNRIESAALAGKIDERKKGDAQRQELISRAMANIKARGGVASNYEAELLREANMGQPFNRIDPSIGRPASTDEKLTAATGIVVGQEAGLGYGARESTRQAAPEPTRASAPAPTTEEALAAVQRFEQRQQERRRSDVMGMRAAGPEGRAAAAAAGKLPRPARVGGVPTRQLTDEQLSAIAANDALPAITRRGASIELMARGTLQNKSSGVITGGSGPSLQQPGGTKVTMRPVATKEERSSVERARAENQRRLDRLAAEQAGQVQSTLEGYERGGERNNPFAGTSVQTERTTQADVQRLVEAARQQRDAAETAEIERMLADDARAAEEAAAATREASQGETATGQLRTIADRARTRLVDQLVSGYAEANDFFTSRVIPAVNRQLQVLSSAPLSAQERARIDDLLGRSRAFMRPNLPADAAVDEGADNASLESQVKERKDARLSQPSGGRIIITGAKLSTQRLAPGITTTVTEKGVSQEIRVVDASRLGPTGRLLQQIARIFGKRLVVFESDTLNADGFVKDGDNENIFINASSQISPLAVFGHELTHLIKRDNPAAYAALQAVVQRGLTDEQRARFAEYYGDDKADLLEEMTSDLVGNRFQEADFWQDVFTEIAKQNPEGAQAIIARVAAALIKAVNAVKQLITQGRFATDAMVGDLDAIKAAVREAVVQYAQSQKQTAMAMEREIARETGRVDLTGKKPFKYTPELQGKKGAPLGVPLVGQGRTDVDADAAAQVRPAPVAEPKRERRALELPSGAKLSRARGAVTEEDLRNSLSDQRISPRMPTAVKAEEDPMGEVRLQPDLETAKRDAAVFIHNVALMAKYPNFRGLKGSAVQKSEQMINQMRDNLVWLYKHWKPEYAERSKLWYVGGNRISTRWADRFNTTVERVAAVIAATSPQKDWFQNVSLAERILEALVFNADKPLAYGQAMREARAQFRAAKKTGEHWSTRIRPEIRRAIEGKSLRELYDPADPKSLYKMAVWIRAWDESTNAQYARVITPEGAFTNEFDKSKKGKPIGLRWQSFPTIIKTLEILQAQDRAAMSDIIGANHKVRSFFNNIVAPFAGEDVTIDTHAVAAALLRPLGSSSVEVKHNFGSGEKGSPGPKNSAVTGLYGTYAIYAEAYRRAAAEVGVLPREMQSITWEAVRGLFRPEQKNATINAEANRIWRQVAEGELSVAKARSQISGLVDGVQDPAWVRSNPGDNEAARDSSYQGELSGHGVPGRGSREPAGGVRGANAGAIPASLSRQREDAEQAPATRQRALSEIPLGELAGRKVAMQVRVEESGETATLTVDAKDALDDINERESALNRLLECLAK